MEELLQTYNKHIDLNELYYLLGVSHPRNIINHNDDELVKHFLYTYSNLGLSATEILSVNDLKQRMLDELQKLQKHAELTNGQKWWCLCLIYLKIGAEYYNLIFFRNTIETILDKANTLSKAELCRYCNTLNDTLSNAIGFDLRIRPSSDKNKSIYISKSYLNLTTNSKSIIDILKKYLSLTEVTNDEVIRERELLDIIGFDYDPWATVFDIFVGQLLVGLESPITDEEGVEDFSSIVEIALLNLVSNSETLPAKLNVASDEISRFIK